MQASAARPCGSRRVRGILTKPGFGLAWRPEQMRRATATFDAAISAATWQISLALVQGFLGNARDGRKGAAAPTSTNDSSAEERRVGKEWVRTCRTRWWAETKQ